MASLPPFPFWCRLEDEKLVLLAFGSGTSSRTRAASTTTSPRWALLNIIHRDNHEETEERPYKKPRTDPIPSPPSSSPSLSLRPPLSQVQSSQGQSSQPRSSQAGKVHGGSSNRSTTTASRSCSQPSATTSTPRSTTKMAPSLLFSSPHDVNEALSLHFGLLGPPRVRREATVGDQNILTRGQRERHQGTERDTPGGRERETPGDNSETMPL
ncbi:hypothetical protein PM082_004123 [Marasmius tenuissimus]|nr:hypothetical protein PM082_004123 [Marasmius tenuissimus]